MFTSYLNYLAAVTTFKRFREGAPSNVYPNTKVEKLLCSNGDNLRALLLNIIYIYLFIFIYFNLSNCNFIV